MEAPNTLSNPRESNVNQLKIGRRNRLEVLRREKQGLYLDTTEESVLLPTKESSGYSPGDWVDVFIYADSQDRLIATTRSPLVQLGEFASLEVVDTAPFGAFLDWGLEKDLLCPKGEQHRPLNQGDRAVVHVLLDEERNLLYATTRLRPHLRRAHNNYDVGEAVDILALWPSDLGFTVLVNEQHEGLIHHNDLLGNVKVGGSYRAWVKELREGGELGLAMKPKGFGGVLEAKPRILAALEEGNGYLNLDDQSDPTLIQNRLGMSKKTFKRAIGNLMKEGRIEMKKRGIQLF